VKEKIFRNTIKNHYANRNKEEKVNERLMKSVPKYLVRDKNQKENKRNGKIEHRDDIIEETDAIDFDHEP